MAGPNSTEERDGHKDKRWSSKRWDSIREGFKENLSQILWFVGVLGLYLLIGLVLFRVLDSYIDPSAIQDDSKEATTRKDLVQALGFLMVGVAGAVGIYFTWRGQRLTQESLEDSRKTTKEEHELTRQGQITERFTRAIDQLGATDNDGNRVLEIRLGGIYALERIDKESPERAYHGTVMEVLTAYVRENAPWPAKSSNKSPERGFIKPPEEDAVSNSAATEAAEQDEGAEQGAEPTTGSPRTDIQAVLDVLKRREEDYVAEKPRVRLDLRGTDLQGADLQGADLQEAYLRGANLQEAHLQEAHLQEAHLQEANLFRANFRGAYLQGADLQEANLQEANLQIAHLQEINLQGAKLKGANLRADLQRAKFEKADLQGARLIGANLYKANFSDANLREANFSEANLRGADLRRAGLDGADLRGASLDGADLRGANLQEARGLTQEQIEWTIGLDETGLREGLNRPPLWSKGIEEQWKIVQERLR